MRRTILAALLFSAVAAAQGVDDWIETALDPRTAPEQRVDALKKVAQANKEGLDKLAEKGLDGRRDPEVVHAVVDTLLRAQDYRPYLERICKLLLVEKHRTKVLRRLQAVWESERGMPLLEGCIAIAKDGQDGPTREAVIYALGKIPRRRAADTIIEVGLASIDESVKNAARAYVARWFGVATLREANDFLLARKFDSFQDLVEGRIDGLIAKEKENEDFRRTTAEKATLADALDEMEKGNAYRLYYARRLAKLAEQNGIQDTAEFARRVYEGLVAELSRDPPDPRVLAHLLTALQPYARDPKDGALWKSKKLDEVRDTIQRMATEVSATGPEHQQLGIAAVRFLGLVDDKGLALYAFAESFPSVDVKRDAIQQLGQLAQRLPKQSAYISTKLASLLAGAEKEPAVRAQILNLLTQPHITVATEPVDVAKVVQGYLEKGLTPELTEAELRDSAIVLGKRRTAEAKDALLKLAKTHEKLLVRKFAVEEGLVPWARADETIHDELIALAIDAERQPLEARRAVIEALGKRGGRRSAATLLALEEEKALDQTLLPAVKEAKLVLLERLANGKGAAAEAPEQKPLDLEAAARLLEQEIGGQDKERLEALAGLVVRACDSVRSPAGTARYRLATLYALLPPEKMKEPELLKRYRDAAANAVFDKLPPPLRETLLLEYRDQLRKDTSDPDRTSGAAGCSVDLAKLAAERKDKVQAAKYWLDAAEYALKAGDGQRARGYLDEAVAGGGVTGDLEPRMQDLRTKLGLKG